LQAPVNAAEKLTCENLLREYTPAVPATDEEHRDAVELLNEFMQRGIP
jgi:hypothetical protein